MAEDPKPGDPANDPTPDPKSDPDPKPGDPAKDPEPVSAEEAARMRQALSAANKEAEKHRLRVKELEDKDKSELQRTSDERDEHKTARSAAELRAMQLEVALDKGLTTTQAKRLIGTTREELEADADELLESFKPAGEDAGGGPARRPTERLRGGGTGTNEPEETDPRKLAAQISRRGF